MIGGMLGNNSCGANSIVYGSTRDHVIEVAGFLSDGTFARFGPTNQTQLNAALNGNRGEACQRIYQSVVSMLANEENRGRLHDKNAYLHDSTLPVKINKFFFSPQINSKAVSQ